MPKIDLHTHSIASPDGALTAADYRQMLATGKLDVIAVTDHDTIDFATALHEQLGGRIIIGEEITTLQGEIIGLFLTATVPPRLSPEETVRRIKAQGGLVYIPHPFETVRKGLSLETLARLAEDVDIIETCNGRAYFQDQSRAAAEWAGSHKLPGAASSDAHGRRGWGRTYSLVSQQPTRENLTGLLQNAQHTTKKVGLLGLCYPKLNRLRKRLHHAE